MANFVIVQSFKSNKPDSFTEQAGIDLTEVKKRAQNMLENSIDVQSVYIYELAAQASKVEVVSWG